MNTQKENKNQQGTTKLIRSVNETRKRRLSELTNYHQTQKQKIFVNPTKVGNIPDVRLLNPKTNELTTYPCFDEKYLKISKQNALKIKERKQDDDCNSDDDVIDQSIMFNLRHLIAALSKENDQVYQIEEYI